jgi:hypothetical protein
MNNELLKNSSYTKWDPGGCYLMIYQPHRLFSADWNQIGQSRKKSWCTAKYSILSVELGKIAISFTEVGKCCGSRLQSRGLKAECESFFFNEEWNWFMRQTDCKLVKWFEMNRNRFQLWIFVWLWWTCWPCNNTERLGFLNNCVTLNVEATLTNLIHFVDGRAMYRHKLLNRRLTVFGLMWGEGGPEGGGAGEKGLLRYSVHSSSAWVLQCYHVTLTESHVSLHLCWHWSSSNRHEMYV